MDLAEWWRARRWRALLELIDQLPSSSRLQEAIYDDPEQAAVIAAARDEGQDDDAPTWSPRLSEFDLHALLLREIAHNVASLAGAKNPTYIPWPKTEVDRQSELLARAYAVGVASRFGFSPEDL